MKISFTLQNKIQTLLYNFVKKIYEIRANR